MKPASSPTSSTRPRAETTNPRSSSESSTAPRNTEVAPDLWLYRQHTIALLRRYFRLSVELGRLPSLLGREFFRTHVSSYRMSSFEDGVIFVHDVERCLESLEYDGQQVIARIVFQEYTAEEAATLLQCARRTIVRRYMEALDHLSGIFLATGLLRAFPTPSKPHEKQREISASAEKAENQETPARCADQDARVNPCFQRISPQRALVQANIIGIIPLTNPRHFANL
jgi:hypothetical protein